MKGFFRSNMLIGSAEILCRLPLIFTAGYLARKIGTEAYGTWALVIVFQGLMAAVAGMGLSSSISRIASGATPDKALGYLLMALSICAWALLAACLATLMFQNTLLYFFNISLQYSTLLPMSLLMTGGAIAEGLMDAYLKAREKISRQVLFILVRTLVEITAVLLIFSTQIIAERSVVEMLSFYILYVFVAKLLIYPALIVFRSTHEIDWPLKLERRAFVHYGMPMVPTVLVSWLVAQGDRLLLGHMVDKHALGIYAFGASMAAYVTYLGYAVYPLLLPRASRLFDQGRFDELRAMFQQSQLVFLMICSTALAFIALFAGEIISLTAGENFAPAATIFFVLALAVGIEQMAGIYQYVFHLVKKPRLILYFNLIYGVLAAGFVYAAVKIGGIAYVPWGVLAAVILLNIVRYLMAKKEFSISIKVEHLAGIFISLFFVILLQHYMSALPLLIKALVMVVLMLALGSALLRQIGRSDAEAADLT